jgi:hypothetical protein
MTMILVTVVHVCDLCHDTSATVFTADLYNEPTIQPPADGGWRDIYDAAADEYRWACPTCVKKHEQNDQSPRLLSESSLSEPQKRGKCTTALQALSRVNSRK